MATRKRWLASLGNAILRAIRRVPSVACDLAGFTGIGSISYGSWLIYPPAGFIVAGVLLIAGAMLIGARFGKERA